MKHYPQKEYNQYDTIVLANGAFPSSQEALTYLQRWQTGVHSDFLACCDGAVNSLIDYCNSLPDIVIGDLDSLSHELRGALHNRLIHISEQETNDLSKTINYLSRELGRRRIILLGATGKREDHTLGNLALLPSYAELLDELVVLTDTGYFRLIKESCTIEIERETEVSFFSFEPKVITVKGVYWEIDDYSLPYLWSGTLNRACESTITVKTQHPILIFIAH